MWVCETEAVLSMGPLTVGEVCLESLDPLLGAGESKHFRVIDL